MEPVIRTIGKNFLTLELTKDYARITELFGALMGDDGGETDRRWMDGLWVLATDGGRYEDRDFQLVTDSFGDRQAELVWSTAAGSIGLRSCWQADVENAVLTRRDVLSNIGDRPVTVRRVLPRLTFPCGEYEIYSQRCLWNNENQGRWVPLHAGSLNLTSSRGRASDGCAPYACLRERQTGRGVVVHVVPMGNWVIRFSARSLGNRQPWLVLEAGLADDDLRLVLEPGAELVLPEIILQPLPDGDPRAAAPGLHRHLRRRLPAPRPGDYPVIYNTWLDRFGELDEEHLRHQALAAREAGCEVFVVDAGWYGRDDDGSWFTRMGDWREKQTGAFNGHMREFADEVRAMGMDFGLWVEPERFGAGSPVVREHPEWFLPTARGYLRMDLSQTAARDFRYRELWELIERYQLRYVKMDCNVELGYDPSGHELYDYFRHWYGLLDRLRAACPNTVIEDCASGGMRADLSSLMHYDLYFPSDTANPVDLLRIREGGFLRLPPGRTLNWAVLKSVGNLPS
ncbi:MAG: alpha-galactosidase, partial [Lentisphaerae bacterium]|nr:alpha-galactosidase [Lentisphaerota bacterium]